MVYVKKFENLKNNNSKKIKKNVLANSIQIHILLGINYYKRHFEKYLSFQFESCMYDDDEYSSDEEYTIKF